MKALPFPGLLLAAGLCIFIQACDEHPAVQYTRSEVPAFDNTVVLRWNRIFLELDRYAAGYRSGPSSHALGYLGFAAYEAVAPGIPGYKSLSPLYPGLDVPVFDERKEYYWPEVLNESYAYLLKRFFFPMETTHPDLYQQIETLRLELRSQYALGISAAIIERSETRGLAVANAVYTWETTDIAGHNAFLNPQPPFNGPHGPGFWEPTFPDFTEAMHPFWGQVRTFILSEQEQTAQQPLSYSEDPNSEFFIQGMEVFTKVKNIRENGPNAYEDAWTAEFWSDDITGLTFSPAARWISIANQVAEKEQINLAEAVELFAKLGMTLADAGVAVWQSKSIYKMERPVSYIRRVMGANDPDAAAFLPILNDVSTGTAGFTPSSPGYPSGHAGFGGGGATILSSFFENNSEYPGTYGLVDNCHTYRSEFLGTPRSFISFQNMAEEDAYSRISLGVNFRMDGEEGLRLGELAAQRVLEMPWKQ